MLEVTRSRELCYFSNQINLDLSFTKTKVRAGQQACSNDTDCSQTQCRDRNKNHFLWPKIIRVYDMSIFRQWEFLYK